MLFMVIERFKNQDPIPVYKRVRDPGIKFPEGLTYVGSWIEPNFDRCFQLMECDDLRLLQQWVLANNRDLGMTFEIVPVVPSKDTREVVAPFLDEKQTRQPPFPRLHEDNSATYGKIVLDSAGKAVIEG